jgi:hypothetical protein
MWTGHVARMKECVQQCVGLMFPVAGQVLTLRVSGFQNADVYSSPVHGVLCFDMFSLLACTVFSVDRGGHAV